MNTPMERLSTANRAVSRSQKGVKTKKRYGFIWVFLIWILLVGGGIAGAYYYSEIWKEEITADVFAQTQIQLDEVSKDYEQKIRTLEQSLTQNIAVLQSKVDALTQLLAFTRDSATDQTDQSNQLYTQLAEVKRQLEELQKNLDVLQ